MDAMDVFIHLAGFVGAWLLVAGPLLQGAIELRDEEMDREGFEKVKGDVEYPQPISRWWWLLAPPVGSGTANPERGGRSRRPRPKSRASWRRRSSRRRWS